MPPKQVRVDADTIYRSETPLRQKKFPNRRRSVRSSGVSTPAPLRQQSTLTQQPHWTVSRTSPTSDVEDEVEDEDGEYEEDELERSRPKRKKRKSEADGKRQTTMTQYVPSSFIGEGYDGPAKLLLQFAQTDSFDGVRDSQSQPVLDGPDDEPRAETYATHNESTGPAAHEDVKMQQDEEEQSQRMQPSSEQGEQRVDSAFSKQQARPRPSPELPISAMNLRTPRRKFMSEIPSSNTPQSAIISICSAKTMPSPERSPLRDKSINAWSQHHTDDARTSPVPESPTKPISPFRLSPVKNRPTFRIPDKPPALQHRSTIPDSEDTATQVTPFKQNKFRSQIPDTQMDMFGEEIAPVTETQPPVETYTGYTQYPGGTYYAEHDDYNYNFDPVCSALDRDAARFMQTQLQRDRIGYDAFHKTRSFSQAEERAEEEPEQKQIEGKREPSLATAQQSQELGDDLPVPNSRSEALEQDFEDPPTQSPQSSAQKPPRPLSESDEIEELDLTGDVVLLNTSVKEVIQIASSPSSKSVSSGKYPSSPPLVVERDARLRAEAEEQLNNAERHSSPPLPIILPIPPSQASTVGGTQLFHSLKRNNQEAAYISSSPPPLPPSTSSPPPEARQHLRRFLEMYDSDDEDDQNEPQLPHYDEEDDDMDLDFVPRRNHDEDLGMGSDNDDESEHDGGHSRLRDILPDTLLDFSLPPPPTQSSVRSTKS